MNVAILLLFEPMMMILIIMQYCFYFDLASAFVFNILVLRFGILLSKVIATTTTTTTTIDNYNTIKLI